MRHHTARVLRLVLATGMLASLTACENRAEVVLRPGSQPETVTMQGGRIVSGFAAGQLRYDVNLTAFRIARHPTTRGEFGECVNRGACVAPGMNACGSGTLMDGPNYAQDVSQDVPVTCVGVSGAQAYCAWVGGRLPTLVEWLAAARGTEPQRFAWGKSSATCAQHALGAEQEGLECARPDGPNLIVGLHKPGAAPSGMEDVLLTPGELLSPATDTRFSACGPDYPACVVRGLEPGAIDSVQPVLKHADGGEYSSTAYGFRCVWVN